MSRAFRLRRPAPTSTTLLAVFLVATVVLACGLALQAFGAARSHRATAESVLADYAGIAAAEYGRIAREDLSRVFDVVFDEVPRRYRPGRMPELFQVRWELDDAAEALDCRCPGLQNPDLLFRGDFRDGSAEAERPDAEGRPGRPSGGGSPTTGAPTAADPHLREVLRYVEERVRSGRVERYGLADLTAVEPSMRGTLLYAIVVDDADRPVVVYGLALPEGALAEMAGHWYARHPLLPAAITRQQPGDTIVQVELGVPGDAPVFASHTDPEWAPSGTDTLEARFGAMVVRASIRPEAADRLVIGGLPSSRLPFSLALLGLTLAVGAAGLWEVRRHHQLAGLREDFISSVSHELRTPLTQIRMLAELQADHKLRTPEERERANRVMARESRRLTQLVENILHFSRTRAAPQPAPTHRTVSLSECVDEVVESFQPLAGSEAATVEVDVPSGTLVPGHRESIRRVVANLLDNALKYGPTEQTVRITARRAGGTVTLAVEDQGPGIPRDARSLVWEPYRRLPRDLDSHRPGSGVGLAVVRSIVEGLGGRARVEEAKGGGARFVVELPAPTASRSEETPRTTEATLGAHPAG